MNLKFLLFVTGPEMFRKIKEEQTRVVFRWIETLSSNKTTELATEWYCAGIASTEIEFVNCVANYQVEFIFDTI